MRGRPVTEGDQRALGRGQKGSCGKKEDSGVPTKRGQSKGPWQSQGETILDGDSEQGNGHTRMFPEERPLKTHLEMERNVGPETSGHDLW